MLVRSAGAGGAAGGPAAEEVEEAVVATRGDEAQQSPGRAEPGCAAAGPLTCM